MIPDAKDALSAERGCVSMKTDAPSLIFGAASLTRETKGDRVKTNHTLTLQDKTLLRKEAKR